MIYFTPIYLAQEPLPEEPLPEEPLPAQLLLQNQNEITCGFLVPVDLDPLGGTDYEFSKMTCSSTKELITNSDTGAEFYIDKTITYGDALLFWFLTIFSIGLIASIIFKFFWRKW